MLELYLKVKKLVLETENPEYNTETYSEITNPENNEETYSEAKNQENNIMIQPKIIKQENGVSDNVESSYNMNNSIPWSYINSKKLFYSSPIYDCFITLFKKKVYQKTIVTND